MEKSIAKEILSLKSQVVLVNPKDAYLKENDQFFWLNQLGIPINACKICTLDCNSCCKIRCNYFTLYYNRAYGTYNEEQGFRFHEIPHNLIREIYEDEQRKKEEEKRSITE